MKCRVRAAEEAAAVALVCLVTPCPGQITECRRGGGGAAPFGQQKATLSALLCAVLCCSYLLCTAKALQRDEGTRAAAHLEHSATSWWSDTVPGGLLPLLPL